MQKRYLLWGIIILIGLAGFRQAEGQITYLPYLKAGYLFTPPSAEDLDYVSVDGGSLDEFLTVNGGNFGAGAQIYLAQGSFGVRREDVRIGLDLGFQKLFTSRFESDESDLSYIYESYDEENEWGLNALVLGKYMPARWPFFLQLGLGPSLVFWQWESVYHSSYQDNEDVESGSEVNLGVLLAAGLNLQVGDSFTVPVMLRIDNLFRYGSTATASLMVGMTFGP